jgi:hypothetical protein
MALHILSLGSIDFELGKATKTAIDLGFRAFLAVLKEKSLMTLTNVVVTKVALTP